MCVISSALVSTTILFVLPRKKNYNKEIFLSDYHRSYFK